MTICIAAIADNNKIIAITDKMLTLGVGVGVATRYEIGGNNKAIKLTNKVVALFAGNVVSANEILDIAKAKIAATTGVLTVNEVANLMKDSYLEYWTAILNNQIFSRYALTLATFMANQQNLNDGLVRDINGILANTNVGVEILVAGVDTNPHLFLISNPGAINSLDAIGYALIGSGSQHAQLSLIESEYNAGISEQNGLYALLEAKKRAEYDPGVGQLCDIVIIGGTYNKVSEIKVEKIMKEFNKSSRSIKRSKATSASKVHRII